MTIVGITHNHDQLGRFFTDADLRRLQDACELRILGSWKSQAYADFRAQLADVEILLGSWGMPPLDADLLAAAPRLRAVCYAAGTVKGFVTDASWRRNIRITTAMHANAVPVAEVTVALIILANKRWFACQDSIRSGGETAFRACYQDGHLGNYGATIGLIGYGAIGRLVHELLQPYHFSVVVYDPYADVQAVEALGGRCCSLYELAEQSHVVSLHAPNIPATKHMINAEVLARMRDGATFINTARGALVDEDALVAELQQGRIQAMLDVTDPEPPAEGHPFYTLPNCWLTPHRAGSSGQEIRRMGAYAIAECLRLHAGDDPRYEVTEAMLETMA